MAVVAVTAAALLAPASSDAAQRARHRRGGSPQAGGSGALAVVRQFEDAYKRKDKKTLIMKLMVPTNENNALEKRYQWLRGYGPHDMPGSVHPPILFQTWQGSFVPTNYKVVSSNPEGGRIHVVVEETGTYHDEDGRWKVVRKRHFKLTQLKGRWWVADYYNAQNAEDYGFWVDDIADKMTKLGK